MLPEWDFEGQRSNPVSTLTAKSASIFTEYAGRHEAPEKFLCNFVMFKICCPIWELLLKADVEAHSSITEPANLSALSGYNQRDFANFCPSFFAEASSLARVKISCANCS